ncbi:MAG TPA: SDR family NAD(P)-dependent oxidoreductase, partial [Pyrinomonadaceae bacterium]
MKLREPKVAYVSNVTGEWITAGEATDAQYWVRHLRQTVRFSEGMGALLKQADSILLEIGPGKTLCGLARRHKDAGEARISLASLPEARQHLAPASESVAATTLQTLGRLWLAGVEINWQGYNKQERRRRVPLPTYPFERQRYWIEAQGRSAKKPASTPVAGRHKEIADWFYVPGWKQSVSPRSIGNGALRVDAGTAWLILLDEYGLGESVARRVEEAGQNVVRVKRGALFEQLDEDLYAVDPSAPGDYQTLLHDIQQRGKKIGKIMHLWSVTGATQNFDPAQAQESGFYSLLSLAQALGEQRFTDAALTSDEADAIDIAVVSDQMQEVTGEDLLYPEKATLLGACGAIPKEYPNINCRSIDVTLPQNGGTTEHLAGQLVAEIMTKSLEEAVAYRGDIRWVQSFERVRLEAGAVEPPALLREGGVYLITGGTGGIGLTLAHYLAETVRARLVLLARTPFPAREEWDVWLETHQADDDLSVKIRKLQAIEETGAEALVLSADVSDEAGMRAALEEARQRFGQFDGVIHAAGIPPRTLMQRTTPEMAAQVFAPKVEGTRILSRLLSDDRLDFMVLCSSHRSFLPDAGTADYSGANAFLDAFARRQNRTDGNLCISINWDGWLEVGMSGLSQTAGGDAPSPANDESVRPGILPHEGVVAFSRILGSTLPQVAVAALDLPAVINYNRTFTAATYWKNLNEATPS